MNEFEFIILYVIFTIVSIVLLATVEDTRRKLDRYRIKYGFDLELEKLDQKDNPNRIAKRQLNFEKRKKRIEIEDTKKKLKDEGIL